MKDYCVRAAEQSVERARENRDVIAEIGGKQQLAEVLVNVDHYEGALEQLQWLLGHPSGAFVPPLRVNPLWDPLRSNPRFQARLEKHENRVRGET